MVRSIDFDLNRNIYTRETGEFGSVLNVAIVGETTTLFKAVKITRRANNSCHDTSNGIRAEYF